MGIRRFFRHLRQRSGLREAAHRLYTSAVRQARLPVFYTGGGVSDTLDGRFDLIVLHVVLVVRRLRRCGEAGRHLSQSLFDVMFDDMDQSLREMGVGDLRVGKRVKQMARAFYGRAEAYDRAFDLAESDKRQKAIAEVLARNIYNGDPPPEDRLLAMADYVQTVIVALDGQDQAVILDGDAQFPPAPDLAEPAAAPAQSAQGGR